jgi:hypothetical protein
MTQGPIRPRRDVMAYTACMLCGGPILTGETLGGMAVHLDPAMPCYDIAWPTGADLPTACESRAYALHRCGQQEGGH